MKMNIKNLTCATVATLAAAFVSTSANAGEFYISGQVGASSLEHTIERDTATAGLPVTDSTGVFTNSETGFSGGFAVGYQHDLTDRFYVGAEGFYNFDNLSTRNIAGVLVTDIDLNSTYGGRVIVGAHATESLSIYAHGGVSVLDFDVRNSYTFAPPMRRRSHTETAFSYGVGAALNITEHTSVFLDYTRIDDVSFGGIPEVAGGTGRVNNNELDLGRISIGLKYAF